VLEYINICSLQILGTGHFGDVYMGILKKNCAQIPVAVKKTKLLVNIQKTGGKTLKECEKLWHLERDSLRDELKIMAHIGIHPNVVQLLGKYI
jgi:serine/threonine protein kinase